ncbi:uncharacterized protein MONBRDRAFT_22420 [Monosiga brevicollis MX1]|uniref:Uncharacterized protein n=1 Tax=Monosiga brevicollis TaxID=81824 RepID=A9UQI8_MONBE|nr:uncharacterized protein MONBRDRAFT_22420 [Monosiga brevicollis MX1]EDQ93053.1 predicted protein [Monosiga brevicollis MX1]|eukprot:XP_001742815.1 hypothetical protein [Monosiga brevicollis MX1]
MAESVGFHASGFPIYSDMARHLDKDLARQLSIDEDDPDVGSTPMPPAPALPDEYKGIEGLEMPSSMSYSKEGVYDYLPAQGGRAGGTTETADSDEDGANALAMPSSMKYSEEGIYDQVPMRGEQGYAEQGSQYTPAAAQAAFTDVVVHDSDMRKAFIQGRTLDDPDRGQKCSRCATCPGFDPHYWRKVCKWCRCARAEHLHIDNTRAVDLTKMVATGSAHGSDKLKQKYAWVPMGLEISLIEAYFRALPTECVPALGTPGEIWRRRQLLVQNPAYDTDWHQCDQLTDKEMTQFRKFDKIRLKEAFDVGDVMPCPDLTRPPDCSECFLKEDGTHWPYCSKYLPADALGESSSTDPDVGHRDSVGSAVAALGLPEMADIKNMRKKRKEKVKQVATPPPMELLKRKAIASGLSCRQCLVGLNVGEPVVKIDRFEDDERSYFHPACLLCSQCGELAVDLRCFVDFGWEERGKQGAEKRLFCGRCWSDNRRPRCAACDETIHQGQHVNELGRAWHFRHFSCYICDANLVVQETYVPREQKPLCITCYEQHIADKCSHCKRAINPSRDSGGRISVGDKHWHPACFQCTRCGCQLQGKPCAPKGDSIFCKKCYKKILRK